MPTAVGFSSHFAALSKRCQGKIMDNGGVWWSGNRNDDLGKEQFVEEGTAAPYPGISGWTGCKRYISTLVVQATNGWRIRQPRLPGCYRTRHNSSWSDPCSMNKCHYKKLIPFQGDIVQYAKTGIISMTPANRKPAIFSDRCIKVSCFHLVRQVIRPNDPSADKIVIARAKWPWAKALHGFFGGTETNTNPFCPGISCISFSPVGVDFGIEPD